MVINSELNKPVKYSNRAIISSLWKLLSTEKDNLSIFAVYAVMISLLYLAIPLAAQILVNTIAAGVLLQPLILISLAILIGLIFLGVLKLLQLYIGEIIQRKIFVRVAINMAERICKIQQKHFSRIYAPELMNRFFDTITLQKALNLILLDVPAAVLQVFTGILLMAFYSPFLMIFDTALIASVILIVLLGRRGIATSLAESGSKYHVAHWLEELARCQIGFKMNSNPEYLLAETDNRILKYLENRKNHFQVLLRQFSASFIVQAFGGAGVLAIGGWLVVHGQLSLGQLVASELIILMILSALDKIMQKLDSWYDLLTAVDKVGYIDKLELERSTGMKVSQNPNGAELTCEDIVFSYNSERRILDRINIKAEAGSRISLVGVSGSGKTSLAYLISGIHEVKEGTILFNKAPINGLNLESLRKNIALVSDYNEIFAATVEENITLGRKHLDEDALARVVDLVELERDLKQYPNGMQTLLLSEGRNISLGQRQRILLARSIIDSPQLLILDEAFGGMDEMTKLKIINKLFDKERPWTILNITHDGEVVAKTDYIYVLEKGMIKEEGLIQALVTDVNSNFVKLFPELSRIKLKEISS